MDERGNDTYAAWTLTPSHYGPDQDFDVIGMGAYTDGNAMGAGVDQWFAEGGDINDAFEEVLDCNAHTGFASAMYKSPPNNETPASSIISMMNCKLQEGRRYADVKAAEMIMGRVYDEHRLDSRNVALVPDFRWRWWWRFRLQDRDGILQLFRIGR